MEIKSDENLLEWFLINVDNGLVCINDQINDFEGPLQFSPTKRRFHPTVRTGVLLIEEGTNATSTNASERATKKRQYLPKKPSLLIGTNATATKAKVTVNRFRHAVNLDEKTYSCQAWQVTGKPRSHALAFIAKISREVHMDEFVHEYFSVDRYRKTYTSKFNPMTSKDQWPHVDLVYKIKKTQNEKKTWEAKKI